MISRGSFLFVMVSMDARTDFCSLAHSFKIYLFIVASTRVHHNCIGIATQRQSHLRLIAITTVTK